MNKKFFVSFLLSLAITFSFTFCLATDNMEQDLQKAGNDVRNFVGGTENKIENATKDIANTSRNVTGTMENNMNNGVTSMRNSYTSMRTSTTENESLMGMNSNTWTWIIVAITAISVIALIWYYSMQYTKNNHYDDED